MQGKTPQIWTVGHSTRRLDELLGLLSAECIVTVADVRRFPASRRHPQFGQAQLAEGLAAAGIQYVHFPELGGRRLAQQGSPNDAWRVEAFRGYADYMMGSEFRAGISRLWDLAALNRTAIMCAEALWWQCHRALIADYLKASGHAVYHIMGTHSIQEHPFTSAARIVSGKLSYSRA